MELAKKRDTEDRESGSQMVAESNTQTFVTLPQPLWEEVQRIAGEQNWSVNEAIVFLTDPEKQSRNGDEMIRAIFGPDSVAQD